MAVLVSYDKHYEIALKSQGLKFHETLYEKTQNLKQEENLSQKR